MTDDWTTINVKKPTKMRFNKYCTDHGQYGKTRDEIMNEVLDCAEQCNENPRVEATTLTTGEDTTNEVNK